MTLDFFYCLTINCIVYVYDSSALKQYVYLEFNNYTFSSASFSARVLYLTKSNLILMYP